MFANITLACMHACGAMLAIHEYVYIYIYIYIHTNVPSACMCLCVLVCLCMHVHVRVFSPSSLCVRETDSTRAK